MCESCNQFEGTPGTQHQRADEVKVWAQRALLERMPDLPIEIEEARELATIEGSFVVPAERRIER
ncbi:MAG TPA: hypothetical protein VGN34_29180 [Ktedonobacteraceae bacterium]